MAFIRVFLFLLPTQYDKHFLTEQRENELLTPQKPASHIVQEKKLLSSLLSSKAPQRGSHCNNVAMWTHQKMKNFQIASSTLEEDATAAVQATKRKRSNDA